MTEENFENVKETLFQKMTLTSEKEEEFKEHLMTKGIYLYKQVYDAILISTGRGTVKYNDVSSFIRYDKNLRDQLYKYLSAAEEFLRSELYNAFDIDKKPDNPLTFEVDSSKFIGKSGFAVSNLYFSSFSKYFTLGKLVKIIKDKNLFCGEKSDLDEIVKLRNKVMHHTILLLSYHKEKDLIDAEIDSIESGIMALFKVLPTQGLKDGFTKGVNIGNFKGGDIDNQPNSTEMRLRRFKGGIFI